MGIRETLLADANAAHIGERRSGTTYYDSAGSRNGTLAGGYEWKPSGANGNYYVDFDGTGSANIGGRVLAAATNWALSVWVRIDSPGGIQVAITNGSPAVDGYAIYCDGSSLRGLLGGVTFFGAGLVVTGQWYHALITRGTGSTYFYRDGALVGSTSMAARPPSNFAVVAADHLLTQGWNGGIAEPLWLPRQATLAEIAWLADPANSLLVETGGSIRLTTRARTRLSARL